MFTFLLVIPSFRIEYCYHKYGTYMYNVYNILLYFSPNASKMKIKEAHKRIMLLNHPDRG